MGALTTDYVGTDWVGTGGEGVKYWLQVLTEVKNRGTEDVSEFVPFLDYSPEIRRVLYPTNAIESLNARFWKATRATGHFPNEQAAMKCPYLVVRSLDPTGSGQQPWISRWKPAPNAFAITFEGRLFQTHQSHQEQATPDQLHPKPTVPTPSSR